MNSDEPRISFIVPAHNEEASLPRTLEAIHESGRAAGQAYEVIVVDDASTDATAEIARQNNARVVSVKHRQIAATRNSGARAARGERLIFVDADTTANPRAVAAAIRCMSNGAVGGGAPVWFHKDEIAPWARPLGFSTIVLLKLIGFTGGAFFFCTHDAFVATGGFNERLFWAEEIVFALALKREGRFVVLWEQVSTSARRLRATSLSGLLLIARRFMMAPFSIFTDRAIVQNIWYESNRAKDEKPPNSLAARISNAIAVLVLLVVITEPIWTWVPWSVTPVSSVLGKIRYGIGVVLCHIGLVLWPAAAFLLVNLLRQKRLTGLVQSLGLIAFLVWQAWGATHGLVHIWTKIAQWLF